MDADIDQLKNLVRLSINVCRKEMATTTLPVVLLADIFEGLTLDLCEDMFTFVEEQVNVWKEDLFFTSCKNNLLRMCNDLVRRLSQTSATVLCGRISLFLAKLFPFSERSGLNIVSEFNLENVTEYGADASEDSVTEIEIAGSKKNIIIDYSLYCKFWSLQDFFRNPNQCYNKVQWKVFCSHATSVLSTFEALKLDYISKDSKDEDDDEKIDDTPYFPKYPTNQKLLDLQIYDVNFRRSVLVQFLILFQYLTSSVKFKSESHELKGDQKEWVQSGIEKIYTLLKETPPDGDRFAANVKNILKREEYWNAWKNEGCPDFKASIAQPSEKCTKTISERRPVGDILKEAHAAGKYYLGNSELTKLWNLSPDNLEACKSKDRDFLPSLEHYFAEAIAQLESSSGKPDDSLLKDGNFGWRALRLVARRSPHFFTYSNNPINQLPDYLEMMVRKIAADRPGKIPEPNEQNDVELEENLFKEEEQPTEEIKHEDDFTDDHNTHIVRLRITVNQLNKFSEAIATNWKVMATKLGYAPDEIKFFEDENPNDMERAKNVLQLWFEDDDDASMENLAYMLEGLQMLNAADIVKAEISNTVSS
ncbi:hypothetical protein RI129_005714 [Pyrocoelia pectoralis]|uniref:Death domain-containing protein n=1 Tax=Pyrocoelia pectoralis TaxID=417401 RepID=A0AAN7VHS2_9COLE